MTTPAIKLWYGYRVMFETSIFPHSKPAAGSSYARRNGGTSITVTGQIPYGSYARILLLWLCTQAVIKKAMRIKFPPVTHLLDQLGIAKHGKLITAIKEQMQLIEQATITCKRGHQQFNFYKMDSDGYFVLSGAFFMKLCSAPVPVDLTSLTSIRKSTLAMDLLLYLSYRLPKIAVDESVEIGLDLLEKQLGADYGRARDFHDAIRDALVHVKAIYPAANAELFTDHIRLLHSLPHVQKILELEMQ